MICAALFMLKIIAPDAEPFYDEAYYVFFVSIHAGIRPKWYNSLEYGMPDMS